MPRKPFLPLIAILILLASLLPACGEAGSPRAPTPTFIPEFPPTPLAGQSVFYVAPGGNDYNPGTMEQPWATLAHAADVVEAGKTVYVRGGMYSVTEQIYPRHSGEADKWITFAAYPGEKPILDAGELSFVGLKSVAAGYPHDQGAFNIEGVRYIRVYGLTLTHAHMAGFMVRDASYVDLINNSVSTTFGPGIGVWDTDADGTSTQHIRVLGNTVTNANTWDMLPSGYAQEGEPPHEAISIAGAKDFEVAYNYIYDSGKEGIDIKEVSNHGRVHHNYINRVARQCLYVDAWFGSIEDIEVDHNIATRCEGAGLVLSVENGISSSNLRVHHNLIYNSLGTGIFFSRWGDGPRRDVQIYNNTVYRNGCGTPNPGSQYFWITGGVFLYSSNLEAITFRDNIVADNCAFQIGYSDHWLKVNPDVTAAFQQKRIVIDHNLVFDRNSVTYPVDVGWPPDDFTLAYAYEGTNAVTSDPRFVDASAGNFLLNSDSPAIQSNASGQDIGAFFAGQPEDFWWLNNFPPVYDLNHLP